MRSLGLWRICGFYLLMAGVGVMATGRHAAAVLLPDFTWSAWGESLLAGLAAGGVLAIASRLAAAHLSWVRALAGEFRNMMGHLAPREAFWVALLSGCSEEILFRGALQPAVGLWLTTLIFGILHVGPTRRFIPWTVMALGAGLLFGGLFACTGNVLAPAVAHALVNFLNLRYLAAGKGRLALGMLASAPERAVYF